MTNYISKQMSINPPFDSNDNRIRLYEMHQPWTNSAEISNSRRGD